jgi:hypothetical protein
MSVLRCAGVEAWLTTSSSGRNAVLGERLAMIATVSLAWMGAAGLDGRCAGGRVAA